MPFRLQCALLLFVVLASACTAPTPVRGRFPHSDWFETDVLVGVGESGQPLATISISAPFRHLVFYQAPDGFRAPYRLRAILRSRGEALRMREWAGQAWADDYEGTRGGLALQRTVTMELDRSVVDLGATSLEIQLLVEGSDRVARAEVPVEVGRFGEGRIVLGELALYRVRDRNDSLSTRTEVLDAALPDPDRFVRRNSGSFDYATGRPWILVRVFDLREEVPDDEIALKVLVFEGTGTEARYERDLPVRRAGYETSVFLELPEGALGFGTNRIEVRLGGTDGVSTTVENLGLDLADTPSWKANLRQVRVLATETEYREMEATPREGRVAAWEAFWDRRDPDPAVPGNPRLEEHYERVAYARAFLRDGFEDGALSDRGQVWILHGRPDSVDNSSPGFENYGSYEVWRYRDRGLSYYFRDVDGLGRYRLVWQEGV